MDKYDQIAQDIFARVTDGRPKNMADFQPLFADLQSEYAKAMRDIAAGASPSSTISHGNGKLWGQAGGELEYVSTRVEHRQRESDKRWYPVMVMRFTDHDHRASPSPNLIDGKYYELEFTLAEE